jgi:hypothetical protein
MSRRYREEMKISEAFNYQTLAIGIRVGKFAY